MAMSRLLLISALVVLGAVVIAEGLRMASSPKTCCFKFETRPVPQKRVTGYSLTSKLCSKSAVVLQTARRQVCVDPTADWVQRIISNLESQSPGQQVPLSA